MGAPFPTSVSLGANFNGASPSGVRASAEGESSSTINKIRTFRTESNRLYGQAASIFQTAYEFQLPEELPTVTFDAALEQFDPFQLGPAVQFPDGLFLDHTFTGEIGDAPELEVVPFEGSTFSKPSATGYEFDGPPAPLASVGAPSAPNKITVDVPQPPSLNIELLPLLEVGSAPPIPALDNLSLTMVDVKPFDLGELTYPDESALDRMEAMIERKFERSPYVERMMPQVMTAVGALLTDNFILDMDQLERGVVDNIERALERHNLITNYVWQRRRLDADRSAVAYNDRVRDRVFAEHKADFDAAVERWRMKLLPVVLRLATEAHAFMAEMKGELYDLDFEFLAAEHQAAISLYNLAVVKFNTQLLRMRAEAAQFRSRVAEVRARADVYRARTQAARTIGQANSALASGYSAEQQAAGMEADAFSSIVDAAAAAARAYDAQMRGMEAQARALKADLMNYQAEVSGWESELTAARAEYARNRGQNRAVIAQNRARVAQMDASTAEQDGIAQQARASAMAAVSDSAQLQAEAAGRSAQFAQQEFENAREGAQYQLGVGRYRADAAEAVSALDMENQINRNISQVNASTAATYGEVSRNAVKAAELTQQYRVQLTDAFVSLYDAVGRADAARIAGELSRYRASFGLRASGNIDYSSQISSDIQYATDVTNAGSNTQRTEWVAAEES